jgi:hypothetical protein
VGVVLNFVLPGAGLWYLGRSKSAVINLLVALIVPAGALVMQSGYLHYIVLAIAAGSAGYAHAVASGMNGVDQVQHSAGAESQDAARQQGV